MRGKRSELMKLSAVIESRRALVDKNQLGRYSLDKSLLYLHAGAYKIVDKTCDIVYNTSMFISAVSLGWQVVIPIVVCVIVQMPIAMFCLYKLARVDQPLSRYILWNIFIIVVFFIGDAVFLIYYYKSKNVKLIDMTPVASASGEAEGAPDQSTEVEAERENGEAEGRAAAAAAREGQSEVPTEGENKQTTTKRG